MMITKETNLNQAKQEGDTSDQSKIFKSCSSSTTWTRLKDPRIVRVSRAFGGKDRHSKVCTVRGLRDRRVRLSVPTAIQLYDLQDRLGFNQPSKVVDWLLNAAKHGIDELPPLQLPPGNFPQNLYPVLSADHHAVRASQAEKGLKTSTSINWDDLSGHPGLNVMDSDATLRAKSKEATEDATDDYKDRNWTRNEEGKQTHRLEGDHDHAYALSNNFFPRLSQSSSLAASLMNNSMPPNSFALRWDPSSLSLSQGGSHGLAAQAEDQFHSFNVVPLPSTVHHMPSGSQVLVYPPGVMQSYFPPAAAEFDPNKHINLQILSSSSQNFFSQTLKQQVGDAANQSVRPFHFNMMANLPPASQSGGGRGEPNKDNDDQFQSR